MQLNARKKASIKLFFWHSTVKVSVIIKGSIPEGIQSFRPVYLPEKSKSHQLKRGQHTNYSNIFLTILIQTSRKLNLEYISLI
jgi:hypothetical protein